MRVSIPRLILGLIVGFVVGSVVMMACHFATMPLYPPPEGLDVMDPAQREEVKAWMETLPAGAYVVAALCHWIGAAAGAVVALLLTQRKDRLPALLMGALFLLAGIANLLSVPHPAWFPFVDLPGYLVVGWLMGRLLVKAPPAADAPPASA